MLPHSGEAEIIIDITNRELRIIIMAASNLAQMSVREVQHSAMKIFIAGVQAVCPRKLVSDALTVSNNKLVVKEREYHVHRNVHVVAFGKAVLGMVQAVDNILGSHIVAGVASVPYGSTSIEGGNFSNVRQNVNTSRLLNNFEIIEGTKDNYPDEAAQRAASKIMNIAETVGKDDLLLVLVSGGGSALLPLPVDEITLEEKQQTTKLLSKKGASIFELNTVRRHLSKIKGGKLAEAAYPASVITLILSDILGDPLDLIASGPTVPDPSAVPDSLRVLEKLGALQDVPRNVLQYLSSAATNNEVTKQSPCDFSHVQNIVVGNNQTAVQAAASMAEKLGYRTFIHSTRVSGEARDVGKFYAALATPSVKNIVASPAICDSEHVHEFIKSCVAEKVPYCVLGAGETTVSVKGSGMGGRNQELALAAAIEMNRLSPNENTLLLSAGTDGQDGPTPAAGAYAFPQLVTKAAGQGLDPVTFLNNNDSFTFYNRLDNGAYLAKTGLTGTNVMDLQILLSPL